MTNRRSVAIQQDSAEVRRAAAQVITGGGIIAFRTDTFYGLGVDPFKSAALRALRALKGREEGKPILVVISEAAEALRLVNATSLFFETLSARHWPGALTLVARARPELPDELTSGTGTIGVRLPDDEDVRALIRTCGGVLTATSANPAGELPAHTAADVRRYFPSGIELVIDGGAARSAQPSTVVDVGGECPRLLREGVVTRTQLQRTLRTINATLRGLGE